MNDIKLAGKHRIVFISLPMSGREDDDIRADIEKAKKAYLQITGRDIRTVAFVNNLDLGKQALEFEKKDAEIHGAEFIEPTWMPVWYLGIALCNLANCDEAFFYGDWENARGCRVELLVCNLYDIPKILTKKDAPLYIDKD